MLIELVVKTVKDKMASWQNVTAPSKQFLTLEGGATEDETKQHQNYFNLKMLPPVASTINTLQL
jgi:hypothetical protein